MSEIHPATDELLPAMLEMASIQKDMLVVMELLAIQTNAHATDPAIEALQGRSREVIRWLLNRRWSRSGEAEE